MAREIIYKYEMRMVKCVVCGVWMEWNGALKINVDVTSRIRGGGQEVEVTTEALNKAKKK